MNSSSNGCSELGSLLAGIFFPEDLTHTCIICASKYTTGNVECFDFAKQNPKGERHSICTTCFRQWARASLEQGFAPGGVGLRCADNECPNVFFYDKYRSHIDADLQKSIEEALQQKCIADSSVNLVRCEDCESFWDVGDSLFFNCFNCGRSQCSRCSRAWDEHHKGRTCEEAEQHAKIKTSERKLETRQNEAVIRRCPKCHVQSIKDSGCNHITCRCGVSYCYICLTLQKNHGGYFPCSESSHVVDQRKLAALAQ